MPYNTKAIKKDLDNKPIPQIFDAVKDDYEVLQGRNGAQRVEIYGPDGNPLSVTSGKLDVRASEIEALLNALGAKDFATQTTLAAVLAKLSADPATQTTLAAVLTKLNAGITTTLTGSSLLEANTVNVTLAGTRQQLPNKPCREVTIIAKRGNTGFIYVGKNNVSSTVYGASLAELDSITLDISNTNEVYIDASVSGEGVSYVAI